MNYIKTLEELEVWCFEQFFLVGNIKGIVSGTAHNRTKISLKAAEHRTLISLGAKEHDTVTQVGAT